MFFIATLEVFILEDNIVIKGNKEGLVVIINMNKFRDFNDMINSLIQNYLMENNFIRDLH